MHKFNYSQSSSRKKENSAFWSFGYKEVVNIGLKSLDLVRGTKIETLLKLPMGMYNKSFRLKYGRLDLSYPPPNLI